MTFFIVKRFLFGISLILVVSTLTFFLIYGDGNTIARNILGENATQEQVAAKAASLGLDRPLIEQFFTWMGHAITGNLGASYFNGQSVVSALASRVPVTLAVVVGSVLLTALVSVCLGMLAAVKRGWIDRAVQVISVAGLSLPNFWVALLLVIWLAIGARIFPPTGYIAPSVSVVAWLSTITLPIIALSLGGVAAATQQVRGAVIDILEADYVRTLKSRGLKDGSILFRHALKNAAPAALTVLSLQFIGLLGGAIVIEKVFALPGLGSLAVGATIQGDVPIVLGVVIVTVILVVLVNLLIDLANGWVNPKVRLQ